MAEQAEIFSHHSPYRHRVRATILLDAGLLTSARTKVAVDHFAWSQSKKGHGPLPPIEASGAGVWAWVHLAFHGRCTTAAAGLAREGRGRHKCPAPLPLAVPPLLRSAQLPLALHSRARATRAPVTASGCSATAGATIPPKAAAAKKRRAAALRRRCCNKRVGGWEQK